MSKTERLCAEHEIVENSLKRVTINGTLDICVAKIGGKFYAVEDRCGHMNGPLSQGKLEGTVIDCPMHHAHFNITSGENVKPPDNPPQPAPQAQPAAVAAAVAVAAPAASAPGAPIPPPAKARIRAMVRTLPLKLFEVKSHGG